VMDEHVKSDSLKAPAKLSTNGQHILRSAKRTEGRGFDKGNSPQQTRCRESLQSASERIRQAAARIRSRPTEMRIVLPLPNVLSS